MMASCTGNDDRIFNELQPAFALSEFAFHAGYNVVAAGLVIPAGCSYSPLRRAAVGRASQQAHDLIASPGRSVRWGKALCLKFAGQGVLGNMRRVVTLESISNRFKLSFVLARQQPEIVPFGRTGRRGEVAG